MQRKKRSSKPKIPKVKQQSSLSKSLQTKGTKGASQGGPHYLSNTSNASVHASAMKDYVSPHARQKKKHMDMITGSLLNLHESYFSSSSPSSPSANKVSSLASLLREGGGFHAPTSNVTPTALLSLTDTAPQALAKIFSETDPKAGGEIPSPDHLASYLGSLDYADFYKVR